MKAKKKKKQEKEKKEKLPKTGADARDSEESRKDKKAKKNKGKEKEKSKSAKKRQNAAPADKTDKSTRDRAVNPAPIKERMEEEDGGIREETASGEGPASAPGLRTVNQERQKPSAGRRAKRRSPEKKLPAQTSEESGSEEEISPAEIFRALGDEVRLQILELLRGEELCGSELLKSVSIVQSTLSHHMKILCESGMVRCRKQGRWSYYSVNPEAIRVVEKYLNTYGEKA